VIVELIALVCDAMGEVAVEYEEGTAAGSGPGACGTGVTCHRFEDHLGTTRAMWDMIGVKARYDYEPLGEMIPASVGNRSSAVCRASP
jgi:hypothetical protein